MAASGKVMPTFKYAKLVRDKIVDHLIASGGTAVYRQLTRIEHRHELVHKIIEEAGEITTADPQDVAAEIADVQQALDDLMALYGLTRKDITKEQSAKNKKNGAFRKGLYVDQVTLRDDDEWVQYYRKHTDRYFEIE